MSVKRSLTILTKSIFKSRLEISRNAATFKAARLEQIGQPLDIEDIKPVKKLLAGQVRIDVHNCSVNASDFLLTQGLNPGKFKLPIVPGFEVSGIVTETKDCTEVATGDRVVALSKDTLGGFAQECIAHENDVWPIPTNLSFESAAAIVDSFGTAILGLVYRGHLSANQSVLVTMAPGHGYAQLEIAANVYKAKVIAVSMNDADTELLRNKGAWAAIAYNEKDMMETVKDLTKGNGVNVIYDTMAGDVLTSCQKCVGHEGHIIVAGYTLNDLPTMKISALLSLPSFSLSGVSLTSYRKHALPVYRQAVSDVLEMHEQGLASPTIAATFPLSEANKAIELIKTTQPIGKVVLDMKK